MPRKGAVRNMFAWGQIRDKLGELKQLCCVHENEKEYRVLLARRPDREQLEAWKRGVVLEDGYKTAPVDIHYETSQGKGAWVRVIMGEGRKRQIRETCQQLGLPIVRILRIRIGTLRVANLKPRQWRYLTTQEVDELKGKVVSPQTNRPPRSQRPQSTPRTPRTPKPARSK